MGRLEQGKWLLRFLASGSHHWTNLFMETTLYADFRERVNRNSSNAEAIVTNKPYADFNWRKHNG